METEFHFKTLTDLIDTCKKYKRRKKRTRNEDSMSYNSDMEQLICCLEPLEKLHDLIGMEDIKKNIIDQLLFYAQDLNTKEMMHICLTGPPGVGKTTVGKILAELYCSLGFLKNDNFKVIGRSDLVGGYLGQTAIKTKKVLKEALGGVLFVDEAYSLGSGKGADDDSYAKECIDTINQFLSENTSNFLMIIAGYKDELERCFFNMNPGLRRRFPWVYNITDYNLKNLKDIFVYQVYENEWCLDQSVKEDNYKILETIFSDKTLFKHNGGDTLALFDFTKISHSRRVFGKKRNIKKKLNIQDIQSGLELLKKKNEIKKNEPPFGMYL
jgi:SpoVK/Ycf46/Vps4 family AAA+-type ATPase